MTITTIGQGTGATYTGENDTYITEASPTASGDLAGAFFADAQSSGNRRHGLIIFDGLSNITPYKAVSAVDLQLRKAGTVASTVTINLHKVLVPWTASQTTWNIRSTGVNWTTAGGLNSTDVDMTPVASFSIGAATDFVNINGNSALNTLVEGWINGSVPNYGLMVVRSPDTAYDTVQTQIRGGLDATQASRPLLTVTHVAGTPPPTVSTVTGSGVAEGTAVRFTVSLSGAPAADIDYTLAFSGTAVGGTDYDSNLANATFSAGLSFTGGNVRFTSGTTTGTIDVTTYDNALDQADRTLILTVGGVASTGGLITDDDAPTVVTFSDGVESFGVVTGVATLGAVSGKDVRFQVDTTNGTKTAGTNYTAIVAQTVTIPAGSLTAAITANTL